MSRSLGRAKRPPPKPRYDPEADDQFVIVETTIGAFDQEEASDPNSVYANDTEAWAVVKQMSSPRIAFWDWHNCLVYLLGSQILHKQYAAVFYATKQYLSGAIEALEEGFLEDAGNLYSEAPWLMNFNVDYTPAWLQRYLPEFDPGVFTRSNPRSNPRRPSRSLRRAAVPRTNPDPVMPFIEELPPHSYLVEESVVDRGGDRPNTIINVFYNDHLGARRLALFTDGNEVDRDSLWDEAYDFVASHQLFWHNIRPVWVSPLRWYKVSEAQFASLPSELRASSYADVDPITGAVFYMIEGEQVAPFEYVGFHVDHYPLQIGAQLGLPQPPLPVGQLPPPEPLAIVATRGRKPKSARTFRATY